MFPSLSPRDPLALELAQNESIVRAHFQDTRANVRRATMQAVRDAYYPAAVTNRANANRPR